MRLAEYTETFFLRVPTLDLFEALFMYSTNLLVLLLECLQAARQWICDLELVGLVSVLVIVQRYFHLLDCCYDTICLFGQLILLCGDNADLVIQSFRQGSEELCSRLAKEESEQKEGDLPRILAIRAHD